MTCSVQPKEVARFISNCQRARSLRTRPYKKVTLIMVGLFTTEATTKIKHLGDELLLMKKTLMFLAMVADYQTAVS